MSYFQTCPACKGEGYLEDDGDVRDDCGRCEDYHGVIRFDLDAALAKAREEGIKEALDLAEAYENRKWESRSRLFRAGHAIAAAETRIAAEAATDIAKKIAALGDTP